MLAWMLGNCHVQESNCWTILGRFPKPSGESENDCLEILVSIVGQTYEQAISTCPVKITVLAAFEGLPNVVRGWTAVEYQEQIDMTLAYRRSEAQCYAHPDNGKPAKKASAKP